MTGRRLTKRIQGAAGLAAVLALLLTAAAPAEASVRLGGCPPASGSQPFLPWGDRAFYLPLPGGGFESGAGAWQLRRASLVGANEPWHVRSPGDGHALALPSGASATSPPVCVGLGHPTLRLFARNTGSPLGLLAVQVVLPTPLGRVALPVGVVARLARTWAPSPRMLTVVNLLALVDGGTPVSFRFTSVGLGSSWEIDDVYLDPYRKG